MNHSIWEFCKRTFPCTLIRSKPILSWSTSGKSNCSFLDVGEQNGKYYRTQMLERIFSICLWNPRRRVCLGFQRGGKFEIWRYKNTLLISHVFTSLLGALDFDLFLFCKTFPLHPLPASSCKISSSITRKESRTLGLLETRLLPALMSQYLQWK